jgi:hypothetical protein
MTHRRLGTAWLAFLLQGCSFTPAKSPLTLVSLSPSSSPIAGNVTLTLTGTGFASGATVTIGEAECTSATVATSVEMTCLVPAGSAGAVDVTVTNPSGSASTREDGFTYVDAVFPTVTSISPTSGSALGGTSVTITGTDFRAAATAKVGGVTCTSPSLVSSTTLTCLTGEKPASATPVTVAVRNSDASEGTKTSAYTYDSTGTATYTSVATVLSVCAGCHGGSGGFFADNWANVRTRVDTTSFDPAQSLLYTKVASDSMPQGGPPLSAGNKAILRSWILGGAQNN